MGYGVNAETQSVYGALLFSLTLREFNELFFAPGGIQLPESPWQRSIEPPLIGVKRIGRGSFLSNNWEFGSAAVHAYADELSDKYKYNFLEGISVVIIQNLGIPEEGSTGDIEELALHLYDSVANKTFRYPSLAVIVPPLFHNDYTITGSSGFHDCIDQSRSLQNQYQSGLIESWTNPIPSHPMKHAIVSEYFLNKTKNRGEGRGFENSLKRLPSNKHRTITREKFINTSPIRLDYLSIAMNILEFNATIRLIKSGLAFSENKAIKFYDINRHLIQAADLLEQRNAQLRMPSWIEDSILTSNPGNGQEWVQWLMDAYCPNESIDQAIKRLTDRSVVESQRQLALNVQSQSEILNKLNNINEEQKTTLDKQNEILITQNAFLSTQTEILTTLKTLNEEQRTTLSLQNDILVTQNKYLEAQKGILEQERKRKEAQARLSLWVERFGLIVAVVAMVITVVGLSAGIAAIPTPPGGMYPYLNALSKAFAALSFGLCLAMMLLLKNEYCPGIWEECFLGIKMPFSRRAAHLFTGITYSLVTTVLGCAFLVFLPDKIWVSIIILLVGIILFLYPLFRYLRDLDVKDDEE